MLGEAGPLDHGRAGPEGVPAAGLQDHHPAGPGCHGQPADLVGRDFTADIPGTKLVGDITYIRTWQGWLYLATVIDCCSREVVGWSMADQMRTGLVCDAISMAAGRATLQPGAIFHRDPRT